jgi:plasmid stabilization system protein ParE
VPKPLKLYLLPGACEDFELISEPIRSEIIRLLRTLRTFPRMGNPLTGEFDGWRAISVGVFRIYYRMIKRGVEVGFIRHSKRRPPKLREP